MFNLPLIIQLPIFFFAVVFHEYAHGWVAYRFGDDTAKVTGRLTLNPLPHIDPIGTILLPLLLIISGSRFIIGWAKPVPINPYRLKDPRRDLIKVSAAGPLANMTLAVVSAMCVWIMKMANIDMMMLIGLLKFSVFINLLLGVFNLVPVPPLDGSNILSGLLPREMAIQYERIKPYGFLIIIILFYTGILWRIIIPIVGILYSILLGGITR